MIQPEFWTTHAGSLPHKKANEAWRIIEQLDVPAWPQLPRRTFRESIYAQYGKGLPGVRIDEAGAKIWFDTGGDLSGELEAFYGRFLTGDVESFGLDDEHAEGFGVMVERLPGLPGAWAKGQVIGPISFGLTVTDRTLRASLYDVHLADVLVKNSAMNARWQVRQLRRLRPNVVIVVDEPYMASFGSAYVSLARSQAVGMLDEVFAAIHTEGGLAGVHCCANTDWSVLLETAVDVLSLDAWGFAENLALYPDELRRFLDRGGLIAWGIVPNDESIRAVTPEEIAGRLRGDADLIARKADGRGVSISPGELFQRSLVTPRCGLGSTTVEVAEEVLAATARVAGILRAGRGGR